LTGLAALVVAQRPGFDLSQIAPDLRDRVKQIQSPLLDISSTEIRRRISSGEAFRYMVLEPTYRYILENNLYCDNSPNPIGNR